MLEPRQQLTFHLRGRVGRQVFVSSCSGSGRPGSGGGRLKSTTHSSSISSDSQDSVGVSHRFLSFENNRFRDGHCPQLCPAIPFPPSRHAAQKTPWTESRNKFAAASLNIIHVKKRIVAAALKPRKKGSAKNRRTGHRPSHISREVGGSFIRVRVTA